MKLLKEQLICFLLVSKHHLCYSPHYFCQSRDFFALLLQSCHFFALVHKSDTFEYKIECEKAIFVPTERNSVSITINRYFCLQRILQMILVQSSIIKKKQFSDNSGDSYHRWNLHRRANTFLRLSNRCFSPSTSLKNANFAPWLASRRRRFVSISCREFSALSRYTFTDGIGSSRREVNTFRKVKRLTRWGYGSNAK